MSVAVHIIGYGARTPLGLDAATSAAAYRSGISAMGDHPFMIDHLGDLMPAAIDAFLDPGSMGKSRLSVLAESALREACEPLTGVSPAKKIPIYLGLPELRPGFTAQDAKQVQEGMRAMEGLPVEIEDVFVSTEGHASGLQAMATAVDRIKERAMEACMIGGVDSYFEPDTIEWLDNNWQLATADARSAFVPGEGAGFCLLASTSFCDRYNLKSIARVMDVSLGHESKRMKTDEACLGEGLTATIRQALHALQLPDETISDIFCDINGERYRGEEWGFVCLRAGQYFLDPTGYQSPADTWGDTGAASGLLFAVLASEAVKNGYANGRRALIWTSSENGLRGAARLEFDVENKA